MFRGRLTRGEGRGKWKPRGEPGAGVRGANQIIRGFGNPLEPERQMWRGRNGSAGASPYWSWSFLGAASGVVLFRRHIGTTPSLEVCATRPRCETGVNSFSKPQTSLCLVGRRSCGALPTSAHHSNWTQSRSKPRKNRLAPGRSARAGKRLTPHLAALNVFWYESHTESLPVEQRRWRGGHCLSI